MQDAIHPPRDLGRARELVASVEWYHTIDLGDGLVTPGHYDHRPFLPLYGLPERLDGKTVLDVGAASGFFSFEFERRGADVTATDLPRWADHDYGPNYEHAPNDEIGGDYLHRPFDIARTLLGSRVKRKLINIYDITPQTVGTFDLVFCASVLVHITDPVKALWRLASVTRDRAIIATTVAPDLLNHSHAEMIGHVRGDGWWVPTPACLELMCVVAGFVGVEWVSDFNLRYRDGTPGGHHGVVHAYKTTAGWTPRTQHRDAILRREQGGEQRRELQRLREQVQVQAEEIAALRAQLQGHERDRVMRFVRLLRRSRAKLAHFFTRPAKRP
jgi:tRNA (mo5U34)-methyltransferase